EAADIIRHPAADGTRYAGPEQLEVGDRGGGHLFSSFGIGSPANHSPSRYSTGRLGPPKASGLAICSRARPVSIVSHSSASCRGGTRNSVAPSLLTLVNVRATPSTARACRAAYLRLSSGSRAA